MILVQYGAGRISQAVKGTFQPTKAATSTDNNGTMVERQVGGMDQWVMVVIGLFLVFTFAGVVYAGFNGWFGPWFQALLQKISGQYS